MILVIQLYSPLRFSDGQKLREIEVEKGTTVKTILDKLDSEGVFGSYGRGILLVMTNNKIIHEDFILEDKQTVKIVLNPDGG